VDGNEIELLKCQLRLSYIYASRANINYGILLTAAGRCGGYFRFRKSPPRRRLVHSLHFDALSIEHTESTAFR